MYCITNPTKPIRHGEIERRGRRWKKEKIVDVTENRSSQFTQATANRPRMRQATSIPNVKLSRGEKVALLCLLLSSRPSVSTSLELLHLILLQTLSSLFLFFFSKFNSPHRFTASKHSTTEVPFPHPRKQFTLSIAK